MILLLLDPCWGSFGHHFLKIRKRLIVVLLDKLFLELLSEVYEHKNILSLSRILLFQKKTLVYWRAYSIFILMLSLTCLSVMSLLSLKTFMYYCKPSRAVDNFESILTSVLKPRSIKSNRHFDGVVVRYDSRSGRQIKPLEATRGCQVDTKNDFSLFFATI